MKIEVTQEHIKTGVKMSCARCPLALAFRVHFPSVCVGSREWWEASKIPRFFELPPEAIEFRQRFDTGKPVHPFTFEV